MDGREMNSDGTTLTPPRLLLVGVWTKNDNLGFSRMKVLWTLISCKSTLSVCLLGAHDLKCLAL